MRISISEKRITPESVRLTDKVTLTSAGAVYIHFGSSHLLPSGFRIESGGKVIYIDPVLMGEAKPADYIFITHAHPDHFSVSDIRMLATSQTKIICSRQAAKKLKAYAPITVAPSDVIDIGGIRCEALPAYSLGFPSHPKRLRNVGFVLMVDGVRIYHSGDTDLLPALEALAGIDVALVAIDGDNLTMSTPEAAKLVNTIRPKIAIPMHYVVGCGKADAFRQLVNDDIHVMILAE